MNQLDYDALIAAPVANDPFAHAVVEGFVIPERLPAITAGLPKLERGGSFPPSSLAMGAEARALFEEIEGPKFRAAVGAKFGLDLDDAPTMVTLRGYSREKDGRIHCDSTAKRVTVLLYLNPQNDAWSRSAGCLRLLRGPDDIEDFVREVPPVNGTLLVFPNTAEAWHGHKQFIGPRYTVQLNYMTNDNAARNELRRHRLSAFVKRFSPAA